MNPFSLKRFLLSCGLESEEYKAIRPLIWRRNTKTFQLVSLFSCLMGALFLLINLALRVNSALPYLLLSLGSLAVYLLFRFIEGRKRPSVTASLLLCYGQLLLDFGYAVMLTIQAGNNAIPATSVIVFIALLPIGIDDRPIRMFSVMLLETALYLLLSFLFKSGDAFSRDIMNGVTFCLVGMMLYAVVCARNVREIYQSQRIEHIQRDVISALASVVEERDEQTGGHIQRTGDYVRMLARKMKQQEQFAQISQTFFNNVALAAPMHDIGKIKIPDQILFKPARLTAEEFEVMKKHAEYGEKIIRRSMQNVEDQAYCDIACRIARSHHERFDGAGYPDGLRGEEIPLEARMMALADVYDALISDRVYKKAYSREESARIIQEGSGTQFDPVLTPLFLSCVNEAE